MIKEDSKNIYIDTKKDLESLYKIKSSRYGSNSDIYVLNNDLLKIFTYFSLISEYYNIEKISKLNINNVSLPKKMIYIDERFSGYSMGYMKGIILPRVNENTKYNHFITNLDEIEETINTFSDNKIEMRDLNCFNILYDEINNKFNIVDIDCYKENRFLSIEEILKDNLFYFENTLLNSICTRNTIESTKLYNSLKDIIRNGIENNLTMVNIFVDIKIYLENYKDREINTIKDIRKVLKNSIQF